MHTCNHIKTYSSAGKFSHLIVWIFWVIRFYFSLLWKKDILPAWGKKNLFSTLRYARNCECMKQRENLKLGRRRMLYLPIVYEHKKRKGHSSMLCLVMWKKNVFFLVFLIKFFVEMKCSGDNFFCRRLMLLLWKLVINFIKFLWKDKYETQIRTKKKC